MYKEVTAHLYQAYKLAHRGKINNKEVIEFDKHKIENLRRLQKQIQNKEWDKIFTYYRFTITDPKIRIVDALHFEGRIVQHILCDLILKPWFEPRLVKENCACRIDKGTDYAIKILRQHMTKILKYEENPYVLKIDIKKFFPSIDSLGWKIFPVENNKLIQILSNNKKRHKKKKIKEMFNNFKTQKDSQQKFNERYVSTQAHLNKGNTYGFQKQYLI